jgi:hypothetical protein
MNSFEEFTIIIGLLAVAFEGIGHLRKYLHNLMH